MAQSFSPPQNPSENLSWVERLALASTPLPARQRTFPTLQTSGLSSLSRCHTEGQQRWPADRPSRSVAHCRQHFRQRRRRAVQGFLARERGWPKRRPRAGDENTWKNCNTPVSTGCVSEGEGSRLPLARARCFACQRGHVPRARKTLPDLLSFRRALPKSCRASLGVGRLFQPAAGGPKPKGCLRASCAPSKRGNTFAIAPAPLANSKTIHRKRLRRTGPFLQPAGVASLPAIEVAGRRSCQKKCAVRPNSSPRQAAKVLRHCLPRGA